MVHCGIFVWCIVELWDEPIGRRCSLFDKHIVMKWNEKDTFTATGISSFPWLTNPNSHSLTICLSFILTQNTTPILRNPWFPSGNILWNCPDTLNTNTVTCWNLSLSHLKRINGEIKYIAQIYKHIQTLQNSMKRIMVFLGTTFYERHIAWEHHIICHTLFKTEANIYQSEAV